MCLESTKVNAALGDGSRAKLDQDPPILRPDDERLEKDPKHQRRRKLLALMWRWFPMSADTVNKTISAPYEQGPYKRLVTGSKHNSCAPVNNVLLLTLLGADGGWGFGIEGDSDEYGNILKVQDGWVKHTPGRMPSVGDTFILYHGKQAAHCGIVCLASADFNEFWICGDAGQPDRTGELHFSTTHKGWWRSYNEPDPGYAPEQPPEQWPKLRAAQAAYLVPRKMNCRDPFDPQISNFYTGKPGVTLRGWRNLTDSRITVKNEAYNPKEGSHDDFLKMRDLILKVEKLAKDEQSWRRAQDAFRAAKGAEPSARSQSLEPAR